MILSPRSCRVIYANPPTLAGMERVINFGTTFHHDCLMNMKSILKWIGAALIFLFSVMLIRTFTFGEEAVDVKSVPLLEIDEEGFAERFAGGLRIPTVAYTDRSKMDPEAFKTFHSYLESNYPKVHRYLKREIIGDLSLLYLWEGTDPSLNPVLLMAHMDVVPVTDESVDDWTHGPFKGDVADGYIWGRGAMDDKASLFSIMEAVEWLLNDGFSPVRSIYISFGYDEEIGGTQGAAKVAELMQSKNIVPEFVLDEGGGLLSGDMLPINSMSAFVAMGEKGYMSVKLTAHGQGGHSSMPGKETTIGILATAIQKLQDNPLPASMTPSIRHMMEAFAPAMPFWVRILIANQWLFEKPFVRYASGRSILSALMRTTTAPTIIEGGVKDNVIPPTATAVVNFRLRPGDSIDWVLEMVRKIVNDKRVHIEIAEGFGSEASNISDVNTPQFDLLATTIHQVFPETVVVPGLSPGGTDSKHFQGLTPHIYRFIPFDRYQGKIEGVHGTNEKLSVKSLRDGVTFYTQLLRNSSSDILSQR